MQLYSLQRVDMQDTNHYTIYLIAMLFILVSTFIIVAELFHFEKEIFICVALIWMVLYFFHKT